MRTITNDKWVRIRITFVSLSNYKPFENASYLLEHITHGSTDYLHNQSPVSCSNNRSTHAVFCIHRTTRIFPAPHTAYCMVPGSSTWNQDTSPCIIERGYLRHNKDSISHASTILGDYRSERLLVITRHLVFLPDMHKMQFSSLDLLQHGWKRPGFLWYVLSSSCSSGFPECIRQFIIPLILPVGLQSGFSSCFYMSNLKNRLENSWKINQSLCKLLFHVWDLSFWFFYHLWHSFLSDPGRYSFLVYPCLPAE